MEQKVTTEDIVNAIQQFVSANEGDEATVELILAIGAELLNISVKEMSDMIQ